MFENIQTELKKLPVSEDLGYDLNRIFTDMRCEAEAKIHEKDLDIENLKYRAEKAESVIQTQELIIKELQHLREKPNIDNNNTKQLLKLKNLKKAKT